MNTALNRERRIRVLVADDHPLVRRMVRTTLQEHPHFEVCAEATDGAEAVEEAKKAKPDVVVLNMAMPRMNGFEAAREIKRQLPQSAIVILSTHADTHFVEEARKIGVRVYVSKSKAGEALVDAIHAAVDGEDFVVLE
jgi:DNA-binding NarL/FixJ family response regulator